MNFLVYNLRLRLASSFALCLSRRTFSLSLRTIRSARSCSTDLRCSKIVSLTRYPGSHFGGALPIMRI